MTLPRSRSRVIRASRSTKHPVMGVAAADGTARAFRQGLGGILMLRRGKWFAVLLFTLAAAVGLGINPSTAAVAAAESDGSFIRADSASFDPLCDAAGALAAGNPQEALRIIREIRTGQPTVAPDSRERRRACADELDAVIASSAVTSLGYCTILRALEEADAAAEALALAAERDVPPRCSARSWIEGEQSAAMKAFPPSTEGIEKAWQDFVDTTLTPLAGVSAFLLAAWGALLVLARLLVLFPFRDPITSKDDRVGMAFLGFTALLFGPVIFVAGVNAGQILGLIMGVAVAVLSVVLIGRWLGALPKLAIEVKGKADSGVDVGLLSAVLRDMGGDAGRGLEIPVGPDLTTLETSVSELSKNDWIAVAQKIILFVTNIKPWRVEVQMESSGLGIARVGRNGREIASQRIAAVDARVTESVDEAEVSDSQRIAAQVAALVIATMLVKYPEDFKPGLYGATKWESIALQYVAAAWYTKATDQKHGVELLRRARRSDPSNRSAELSHWKFRHRYSTKEPDLHEYGEFLRIQIPILKDWQEWELFDRSVVAYLAVWRNWTAAKAQTASKGDNEGTPTAEDWWLLDHSALGTADEFRPEVGWLEDVLTEHSSAPRRGARGSVDSDKRKATAQIDLKLLREPQPPAMIWDGSVPPLAEAMSGSPYVAYAIGCAKSRLGFPSDAYRAVLAQAGRESDIADFARRDPELARVRDEDWFVEIFGRDPEPELTYAPFEQYRELLEVTTRGELVDVAWTSELGVDLVLLSRLKWAAELSLRAEATDAVLTTPPSLFRWLSAFVGMPSTRPLGRDARMVAVRHLYERKTDPTCENVTVDVDALLERLRDTGYCGSRTDLLNWLVRVKATPVN